jgi:hypothetical protein
VADECFRNSYQRESLLFNLQRKKRYSNVTHYNLKREEKNKNCVAAVRIGKVEALEGWTDTRQNVFRKKSNHSSSALRTIWRVTHYFAKDSKPFCDGDFRRKYSQHVVQEI